MKLLLDSSALAKRYVVEDGSEAVDRLLQGASQLGLCVLVVPEIVSGLNRRVREKALSGRDYGKAKRHLLADVHDAMMLQLTPAVISQAVKLLETNTLRAMDALHIACALEWGADHFASADQRQQKAAKKAGLTVTNIG